MPVFPPFFCVMVRRAFVNLSLLSRSLIVYTQQYKSYKINKSRGFHILFHRTLFRSWFSDYHTFCVFLLPVIPLVDNLICTKFLATVAMLACLLLLLPYVITFCCVCPRARRL
jgi:hypothetical protein